ncbi:hypothetical protein BKA69DRAFT_645223 [Paraphysoderma sedebokerense]|nr:hypothetical protein BKA69DRAFT_645223 [Paraphysoderma sedebokerense]
MVYIGSDNTRTPGHVDICGSYGHNLMVHGSREARSVWIIVPTEYKAQATKLWSYETTSVDLDNQVLTYRDLINAEFPVYIFEQKIDEFIIIPSDAIHQVSNSGGPSVKVAWNRTTAQTLKYWFDKASEHYSFIRKPEIYKNKSLVYLSLQKYVRRLQSLDDLRSQPRSFLGDYAILVDLFKSILLDEHIDVSKLEYPILETNHDPRDFLSRTCDFCHQDIFNRFFHCSRSECLSKANSNLKLGRAFDEKGGYDLCIRCYAIGRGCKHSEEMEFCKFWEFDDLLQFLHLAVRTFNTSELRKEEGLSALVLSSESLEDFGRDRSHSSAATLACILKIDRLRTQKLVRLACSIFCVSAKTDIP